METKTKFSLQMCEQFQYSLMLLQQANIISVETLRQILDLAIKNILVNNGTAISNFGTVTSSKPDLIKELYAALSNFIIQVTRYDAPKEQMEEYCLENLKIHSSYSNMIIECCLKNRVELRKKLETIDTLTEAMLTGVDWKLDYIVKTSELSAIDSGAVFRIRLVSKQYNPDTNQNETKYIEFSCDIVELTDLVSKLKDVTHHVEKLSSSNN